MLRLQKYYLGFLLLILLFSCKKETEVGRIDLLKSHYGEIKIDLKKGEQVNFWADIDINYKQIPDFYFNIEFYKDNLMVQQNNFVSPMDADPKENEIKTTENDLTTHNFYGLLYWHFIAKSSGKFTFKASMLKNKSPEFSLNKADVVFVKRSYMWN